METQDQFTKTDNNLHPSIMQMFVAKKIIGRNQYNALKSYDFLNMTEIQMEDFEKERKMTVGDAIRKIAEYEEMLNITDARKKVAAYFETLSNKVDTIQVETGTKEILWKLFNNGFYQVTGKEFIKTNETLKNLKPIFQYFLGDPEFLKLNENYSFQKGLLIVGDYGNGKTSIMRAFELGLRNSNISFKGYTTNEAVTMFERAETQLGKDEVIRQLTTGTRYFDDLKTEREASNFGKYDLFKEILEIRYDRKLKTHVTMNYAKDFPFDLEKALDEIATRYGERLYDRIFEMFNIIEFHGKSFRK